ncbi:MAG: pilin [Clostridia bacterium]|nr:pilin [Clostridia bacterium]
MGMTAQLLAGEYTGTQFMKELGNLVVVIVSIAGALMTLYAVYIGYLFASASDANKRKAAKTRLIKVIASSLIIVGLASVLSVINVNFNKVESNNSQSSNSDLTAVASYTYNGSPVMVFKHEARQSMVKGTLKFDPGNIYIEETPISLAGRTARFSSCSIIAPSGNGYTVNFNLSTNELIVSYKYSAAELYNNSGKIFLPSASNENNQDIIKILLTFCYTDEPAKIFPVTVDVLLGKEGNEINFWK